MVLSGVISTLVFTGVSNFQKTVRFFDPPCTYSMMSLKTHTPLIATIYVVYMCYALFRKPSTWRDNTSLSSRLGLCSWIQLAPWLRFTR